MIFRSALFSVSALAGMAFKWLQMPIPWLLGALAVALFVKARVDETAEWPRLYRSAGLIVVGYSVGRYLTLDALNGISGQLPGMLAATLSSIVVALLIACLTARQEGLDLQSCVMGIMPGGFTQMAVMCDEDGRADKNIVVLMQSLRLMSVIAAVPFLAVHVLAGRPVGSEFSLTVDNGIPYWYVLPLAAVGGYVADRLGVATPYLMAPIIVAIAASLQIGSLNTVDPFLMAAAQISIGLNIGMGMDPKKLRELKRLLPYTFAGIFVMLVVNILVAVLLARYYGYSLVTAFLAMAPGGLGEMCLVGLSLNENVSVILTYQLFRFLFLNIAVPLGLNHFFAKKAAKGAQAG